MKISEINIWIGNKIANAVGTMWCCYAFSILVLIPLFMPSTSTVIQYISSAFLQLTLLPLIIFAQSIQGQTTEARAKKDHRMICEELKILRTELEVLKTTNTYITEIHAKIISVNPPPAA